MYAAILTSARRFDFVSILISILKSDPHFETPLGRKFAATCEDSPILPLA